MFHQHKYSDPEALAGKTVFITGPASSLGAAQAEQDIKVTAVIAGAMRTPFLLDRVPAIDAGRLQGPTNVVQASHAVLLLRTESVVAELTVRPMRASSWP